MSFFREKTIKATRRNHLCESCGKNIQDGSPAFYNVQHYDGDFLAWYSHVECRIAELAFNKDRGTWGEEYEMLHSILEDDEAEEWSAWLREHHPIAAERVLGSAG